MFERILVPLDESTLAECVLPHVVAVAQAFKSEVHLLSVVAGDVAEEGQPVDPVSWQVKRTETEAYLQDAMERLKKVELSVNVHLMEGYPAECIVDVSRKLDIDLIVLSSHGQTGLTPWTIGSITQKVMRRAFVSLLIVRAFRGSGVEGLTDARYRHIFVPLDGSQRAECVLPLARRLSQFHEADVTLAHVVNTPEMPYKCPMSSEDVNLQRQFVERNKNAAAEYLENLRAHLTPQFRTHMVVSADVALSLQDLAAVERADLVLLSAHGYSGRCNRPYGSVCVSLIEYGTAPLLVMQDVSCDEADETEAELVAQEHKGH